MRPYFYIMPLISSRVSTWTFPPHTKGSSRYARLHTCRINHRINNSYAKFTPHKIVHRSVVVSVKEDCMWIKNDDTLFGVNITLTNIWGQRKKKKWICTTAQGLIPEINFIWIMGLSDEKEKTMSRDISKCFLSIYLDPELIINKIRYEIRIIFSMHLVIIRIIRWQWISY